MDDAFYKEMGQRIAKLRRAKGWTQEGMGRHTKITSSYLARIEIGLRHPTLDVLGQLARALEVPLWRLLTDSRMTSEERSWRRNARELRRLVDELPAKDVKMLTHLARRLHASQGK